MCSGWRVHGFEVLHSQVLQTSGMSVRSQRSLLATSDSAMGGNGECDVFACSGARVEASGAAALPTQARGTFRSMGHRYP